VLRPSIPRAQGNGASNKQNIRPHDRSRAGAEQASKHTHKQTHEQTNK
jgi:hypothetical protein